MLDTSRLGAWAKLPFFDQTLPEIETKLRAETREILPPPDQVFAALELCQPEDVRVVILGQDPYPTPGHAHGLAFSAEHGTTPFPKSLRNIFKEMQDDLGGAPTSTDLRFWARQGVLLLNSVLTTPAKDARGHRGIGWEALTQDVLETLDASPRALLLWGKDAQLAGRGLKHPDHLIIRTAHPSPLSAYRGFFGSRPFSTVNQWLMNRHADCIDWIGTV